MRVKADDNDTYLQNEGGEHDNDEFQLPDISEEHEGVTKVRQTSKKKKGLDGNLSVVMDPNIIEEEEEDEENKPGQSDFLAYTGAIGAAIFLGLADYLASLLATLGLSGIFAEWFGCIMAWGCYHVYCLLNWCCSSDESDKFYFTKAKSMYYEVDEDAQVTEHGKSVK